MTFSITPAPWACRSRERATGLSRMSFSQSSLSGAISASDGHREVTFEMRISLRAASAMLLTSACVLYAAVHTDCDHKADFSRYHTYSWIGVKAGNSLWQERITQAVDTALAAKGWSKV